MSIATIMALSYIHMQMQIVDLAYQGNQKEHEIKELVEENGNSTYKILMLKSANNIGATMFHDDSDMQFADADAVIQIATSEKFLAENHLGAEPKLAKQTNPFLNLLSFGVEAEAKTAE